MRVVVGKLCPIGRALLTVIGPRGDWLAAGDAHVSQRATNATVLDQLRKE